MSSDSHRNLSLKSLRAPISDKPAFLAPYTASTTPRIKPPSTTQNRNPPIIENVKEKISQNQKTLLGFTRETLLTRNDSTRPHLTVLSGLVSTPSSKQLVSNINASPIFNTKRSQFEANQLKSGIKSLNNLNSFPAGLNRGNMLINDIPNVRSLIQEAHDKKMQKTLAKIERDDQVKNDPYRLSATVGNSPLVSRRLISVDSKRQAVEKKSKKVHKVSMLDHLQNKGVNSLSEDEGMNLNGLDIEDGGKGGVGENAIESLILDSQRAPNTERMDVVGSLAYMSCNDLNNVKMVATLPVISETSRQPKSIEEVYVPSINSEFVKKRNERFTQKKSKTVIKKNIVKFSLESPNVFSHSPLLRSPTCFIQTSVTSKPERLTKGQEDVVASERVSIEIMSKAEPELASIQFKENRRAPNPLLDRNFTRELIRRRSKVSPLKGSKAKSDGSLRRMVSGIGRFYIKKLSSHMTKLKQLKLTLGEVMTKNVFSKVPYQKKGSKQLIEATKIGKIENVEKILQTYGKYIVYDFDHIYQTALHFAVKRGFANIAELLINYGADVDAKDMTGRTPLFFAIKYNQLELVKLLLGSGAEPWMTEEFNYKVLSQDNPAIHKKILEAQITHVLLRWAPQHTRVSCWQRATINEALKYQFSF